MPPNDPHQIIRDHNLDCHPGDQVTLTLGGTPVITTTTGPAYLDGDRPLVPIAYVKYPIDPRRLTILHPRQLTLQI
jgi:hypothetical protein